MTVALYDCTNLVTLFFCAVLEFVYAQSPHIMRGMMIGVVFWISSIFSSISSLILFLFSYHFVERLPHMSCGFWYYLLFLVFGIVTFTLYLIASRWYQNRRRDTESGHYYRLCTSWFNYDNNYCRQFYRILLMHPCKKIQKTTEDWVHRKKELIC